MEQWIPLIIIWLILNLISFLQFGIDKAKARRGSWRIPEKTLFLTAIIGGSVGAWLGMQVFRHKTKHASFKYGIPAIIMIQVLVFIVIIMKI